MSRYIINGDIDDWFALAFGALATMFGVVATDAQQKLYAELLGDIPPERLRVAFRKTAQTHQYRNLPLPGEIRKHVEPDDNERAMLAWNALENAARTAGAWTSIDVEDAAAAMALQSVFGDWPTFCDMEEGPQLAIGRQSFIAAYKQARVQTLSSTTPERTRLTGRCGAPPPEVAQRTWVAQIGADGQVTVERDRPALPE